MPVSGPGRSKLQPALAASVGRITFAGDYVVHPGMDSAISSAQAAARHVRLTLEEPRLVDDSGARGYHR